MLVDRGHSFKKVLEVYRNCNYKYAAAADFLYYEEDSFIKAKITLAKKTGENPYEKVNEKDIAAALK